MPDDNFEVIINADGRRKKILRDGHRVRVPLMLRDSANPALTPLQHAVASRQQLSDAELASCRPGFRYGQRAMSDAKATAYQLYDAEIGRAYLKPLGFGNDPALTGVGSHGPRQEPPAGGPCTKDGWPGVWRRGADGKMVCDITAAQRDVKAQLRSRIDPDEDDDEEEDNGAERSVAQAASDHQQRMAKIYDAMDQELRERWRQP
jgi:hypothetical protein